MTSGAFHLTVIAMSSSSRALDLWTIWLTANGAAGRSGCARSWAASASVISCSHSSSCEMGRALSAGKAPTIPALHWAITKAGCETMNSGAPTTGSLSLSRRMSGSAMQVPSAAACNPPSSFTHKPTARTRASVWPMSSFRLRQPGAKVLSDAATSQCLREPRHEHPRFVHERMRRIDHQKSCARERHLAVCAGGPIADVEFEPQDVGRTKRGDRVEKAGVDLSFADRAPRDVGPGRPLLQRAFERPLDGGGFVRRLERRVDQDDSATLLGRQISVERDIAVRAHDAEPPIAPKRGDQRLAFVRVRFAERDAILRTHERLRDRRRTRIAQRPAFGVMRADGSKIGAQELGDRRGRGTRQNPGDSLAPLRRTLRLGARQIESARPGMGVDETEGRFLAGNINENAGQNGVLEHVGEIAGMKGVSVVDRNDPPTPRPPDLPERRRRVDLDDLAALDPDGAGEELE